MKILVDEKPYYKSDCPFCKAHYGYESSYETCELTTRRGDYFDNFCEVFSENNFDLCPYFKVAEK